MRVNPPNPYALSKRPDYRLRKGYVLIATTIGLAFLLGSVGLGVDIGRMYIAKSESQAFVDASALAAATKLDGTNAGINAAENAVSNNTSQWRFGTSPFATVETAFATASDGTFTTAPPDPPTDYRFVRVTAQVNLPMYLIRVLAGSSSIIAASAISGVTPLTTIRHGVFPFSPITRKGSYTDPATGNVYTPQPDDASDPYGFKIGNEYTLVWGAPGTNSDCGTDKRTNSTPNPKQPLANNSNERGYCCVATTAATLREAIVGGNTDIETIGQDIWMDNGQKNTDPSAIGWRTEMDSDPDSKNYTDYVAAGKGNGARIVVVPVNAGWVTNFQNIGFAAFFLENSKYYNGLNGNDSACGIYIGSWTTGVRYPPGSGSGAWVLKLFQ